MSQQETFGNTEIIMVEKTTSKCKCGNNSVIMVRNNQEINHFCRNCARKDWIKMGEKYE